MTVHGLRRLIGVIALTALPVAARGQIARPAKAPPRTGATASVSRTVMSETELTDYIKKVHARIAGRISATSRSNAEQILLNIRAEEKSPAAIAFAASGIWIAGHPEEALYVMGVACNADPTNAEKLNNYAAFITMSGAPDIALPILLKLANKYPANSTVLNNIGQAWFDLGNIEEAKKNLDAATRAFAYHAQANDTKAMIEEAKGNKAAAIVALKNSLQRSYSQDRMARLEELGGTLGALPDWGFHMPQDALGLDKIIPPKYPKELGELAGLKEKWERFKGEVLQREAELEAKEAALKEAVNARRAADEKRLGLAAKRTDVQSQRRLALMLQQDAPPFFAKAMAKLRSEFGEEAGGLLDIGKEQEMVEMRAKVLAETDVLQKQWAEELVPIAEASLAQTGEGMANRREPFCGKKNAVSAKYLGQINAKFEKYGLAQMNYRRKTANTRAYYLQYATPGGDDNVALMVIGEKLRYLGGMYSLPVLLEAEQCASPEKYQKSGMGQLADFYDLHCDNKSSLGVPGFGSIAIACNKMTTSFEAGPVAANWTENLDNGVITNGSVEIEFGVSENLPVGSQEIVGSTKHFDEPFNAELAAQIKVGATAFIEIKDGVISDFGAKVDAKATSELSVGKGSISGSIGMESRFGWNSGVTTTGTGVLSGLKM